MFTWETIQQGMKLPDLILEINRRMRSLWVLLRGVRRDNDSRDLVVGDPLRSDVGFVLVKQGATPTTPPAGQAVLFLRDNGAGKMQLAIVYPSGAVVTLSTEP